jgi:hypothetical protein
MIQRNSLSRARPVRELTWCGAVGVSVILSGLATAERPDPAGATLACDTVRQPSGTVVAQEAAPKLAFDPPVLDLGDVVPEVSTVGKVKIRNLTGNPLRIVRAVANCSCTTPSWPTETIAPGAVAETEITMTPGVQQGVKLVKVVSFEIEGGGIENYTVQGNVGLFVNFAPESLMAPASAEDDASTAAQFTLESADGTPFKVVSIEPAIGSSPGTEPALKQVVTIDWAKWRGAKRPIKVAIKTDHPKAPTFSPVLKRPKAPRAPAAQN